MVAGVRFPLALLHATASTFFLFRLMQMLVATTDSPIDDIEERARIEFTQVKEDSKVAPRSRTLPKRRASDAPPETPVEKNNTTETPGSQISVLGPDLVGDPDIELPILKTTAGDTGAAPLARVTPTYPRRAREQMLQGWVKVMFDLSATGATTNVRVIDSNPKRIFDRAAARAVSKWKYRPRIDNGRAIEEKGLTVTLKFELEDER